MKTKTPFNLMPTWTTLVMAIAVGFCGSSVDAAQQEIAVIVTLANPLELPGVRISSDGQGPIEQLDSYDQTVDRQLKSFFGLGGQLRFHVLLHSARTIASH